MANHLLCNKDELTEHKPRSFIVESDEGKLDLFVIKLQNDIVAYKNYCPHLGIPLNWQPDDFLSIEETHIQCATHGALFTLEEGNCIAGPCSGDRLDTLALELKGDEVWLKL